MPFFVPTGILLDAMIYAAAKTNENPVLPLNSVFVWSILVHWKYKEGLKQLDKTYFNKNIDIWKKTARILMGMFFLREQDVFTNIIRNVQGALIRDGVLPEVFT